MSRRRQRLTYPPELASGPRIGGKFVGPYTGTMAIWKGRPPTMDPTYEESEPGSLVIGAIGGANIGDTVTIEFEGGNAWGGVTTRTFQIGQGLSAELHAGRFQHVSCRAVTPLPAGMELFFSWTWDILGSSSLYQYQNYVAGAGPLQINLPEGTQTILVRDTCQLTFRIPQFSTTFQVSANAGEEVSAYWGALSCNVNNQFIFKMRGI
jgi:hypothetical protein